MGECGGFKTIVRKPKKKLRRKRFKLLFVGICCTIFGFTLSFIFETKELILNNYIGQSLIKINQDLNSKIYFPKAPKKTIFGLIDEVNSINLKI